MASLAVTGTAGGLLKYTDDNAKVIRIVTAHIVDYYSGRSGVLHIESTHGTINIKLNDQTAVDAAIVLLDSKF